MDLEDIEWFSPEVKKFYELFNKLYTKVVMNKYPYVKKMFIDPESFNNVFLEENRRWSEDVDVILCCDYNSEVYDNAKLQGRDSAEMGGDMVKFMVDLVKMIPSSSEILGETKIYPKLINNQTKYCKGVVQYHHNYG